MLSKRLIAVNLSAAVLMAVMTGCGNTSGPASDSASEQQAAEQTSEVRAETGEQAQEQGAAKEETALAGIAAMEDFYHRIAMPANLKELGIAPTEEQIRAMAASCAKASGSAGA